MVKVFFDTNALTGIYAYSSNTLQQIVDCFYQLEENSKYKFIIPATVKDEYDRHYHQSRSRTGDKYPIAVFRKEFDSQKDLIKSRIKKIQPFKLSDIYDTKIDDEIAKFIFDSNLHLDSIENELKLLEQHNNTDSIDDDNDTLLSFVNTHSLPKLPLQDKLQMAALAEVRFSQNIKPGLTDQKKQEEYPFRKYGDVFIWYEILSNSCDEDTVVIIENEKKADWWETKGSGTIASELEEEFKEKYPKARIEMLSFDNFFEKHMESYLESETIIEINRMRNEIKEYIDKCDYITDIENRLIDLFSEQEIENYLLGESLEGGSIGEVNDIVITRISIDKSTAYPAYDSFDSTMNDKCLANVFVDCSVISEFDKESIAAVIDLTVCFKIEIMYIYDLIVNSKTISAVFNSEKHTIKAYEIKKNITYGFDEEEVCGLYGNCTHCSSPINDDNYGDGTLCYNCMIADADDE